VIEKFRASTTGLKTVGGAACATPAWVAIVIASNAKT
jgi:hypothetical protein